MGAWGLNILEEDSAADAYGEYIDRFNASESHDTILAAMIMTNHELLKDDDDRIGFWLGVSKAQWECGALSPRAFDEVKQIVNTGTGLHRWGEPGEKVRRDRERALDTFLKKLATPNPKAKKRRKGIIIEPVFQTGHCLAIRLKDGEYAAAIVTAVGEETPRLGADTYGINVVAQLDYKSASLPGADVFEKRQFLELYYDGCLPGTNVVKLFRLGFREVKERFAIVGRTKPRDADPQNATRGGGWDFAEQISKQRHWQALKDRL